MLLPAVQSPPVPQGDDDAAFLRGFGVLERLGLSFDCWQVCPAQTGAWIVCDHFTSVENKPFGSDQQSSSMDEC